VRRTIHVALPVDQVYAYLVRLENIVDYAGPITAIHSMTTPEVGTGTRLTVDVTFLGRRFHQRAECSVQQPPMRFEARSVEGRFYFEAGFSLHPDAGGTRIEAGGRARSSGLIRVAEPVVGYFIERQIDGDFERLKRRLDNLAG